MSKPEIAVVIPTRGREARLAFALEALAEQTLDRSRFEVIVVRDSDARPPFASIPEGLNVRYLTAPGVSGPVTKRNRGWRAAVAPVIAFTDDDCRPTATWLERLLAADQGPQAFLQGRTEPDPDEGHLLYGLARSVEIVGPSRWYETCNIAYHRALLELLGGLDEDFEFVGDDTDLGLRAREAGAALVYVDDARVRHAVLPRSLPAAVREAARLVNAPMVVARHPQQRDAVHARVFARSTHAAILLAVAGLLSRRPLLAAITLIRYVDPALDLPRLPMRTMLRVLLHMPARASVDAAEVVATVRGALRYRTFLL